ncbi:hypothetical protein [Plantactinospora sp. GCM10030261]|uniref:hypothetical protein n=1 Tax=Plantactinospora sp. GCM10030261 TaxID=3273420 RepID=UPI003620F319
MTTSVKPARVDRLQDGVLVLIVLLVGAMAGAASFSHVHDWTMSNSPTGTGDWFGWANAVISELIPTASLIEIGRRRRANKPIGYPMILLVAAVGVSLTAQLAVAEPTVFGWIVSALPALAFFALSKLVFTATTARPTNPVPAPVPATSVPAQSSDTTADTEVSPAADTTTRATTAVTGEQTETEQPDETEPSAPATPEPTPAAPEPVPTPVSTASSGLNPRLLTGARIITDAHAKAHGDPITAGQLAVRLRVPTTTAADILTALTNTNQPSINDRPHNGTTVGAAK